MYYWFVFCDNNEYIRRRYNADYLIVKSNNQRKTKKFLRDISDMLGIRAIDSGDVHLLSQFAINGERCFIKGKTVYMEVPKNTVVVTTLL